MKTNKVSKVIGVAAITLMMAGVMVGCGNSQADVTEIAEDEAPKAASGNAGYVKTLEDAEETDLAKNDAADESANAVSDAQADGYFTEGVYVNYAAEAENPDKTYFYVFRGDGTGSIEDGEVMTSNYMEYEQGDGVVTFHIGSNDTITDEFKVDSSENGMVKGSFEDGLELVFEPLQGEDPYTFDAANYVRAARGEDFVYTSGYGWRVRYNRDKFEVNGGGPVTTFVYTGECAGTNMVSVTYTVDNNAEDAIKELGEAYGDKAVFTESTFPGTM
ncbi:hypothetical protein [Butyrivibrio sp. INlla16]|uniref:hypothetical protein n=1 Tax=Butyrivibrio sp. INlla16 TaxID=1520807 RepID=UPI0008823A16|nr:hypothetical protein [Butyrivibrio sp. INlla16]SDB07363.1 hypothetical protein SAMN02910263_00294 [Butyrivibrio sp. INlla16]